jgi:hypothetical protein
LGGQTARPQSCSPCRGAPWVCGRPIVDGDHIAFVDDTLDPYDVFDRDRDAPAEGRSEVAFALAGVRDEHDACAVARRYGSLGNQDTYCSARCRDAAKKRRRRAKNAT